MQVNFIYNKDKDIWCLLNKGKNSNNSQNSTKQYQQLVATYGENPTPEMAAIFINEYIIDNKIDIQKCVMDFQKEWGNVSNEFQRITETIFGTSLSNEVTAYLTINSRSPYSIQDNFFFIFLKSTQVRKIIMHELWHFYTWYGLGVDQEERLGKQKYNDLKESLTVLLNVECGDLLSDGMVDVGYPQHQEIRQKIIEYWKRNKNINSLWESLI